MGILSTAVLALALVESVVEAAVLDARQDTKTGKYCDSTQRNVCYSESTATTSGTVFRVAIPEVAKAPFDTLVQVVAPVNVGWAGIAWGGSMSQNPLTVVWMNGNQGVVSSRWATYVLVSIPTANHHYILAWSLTETVPAAIRHRQLMLAPRIRF